MEAVAGDSSGRRYTRVSDGRRTAIHMQCGLPQAPGHAISDFVRIAGWLNDTGLSAPNILDGDETAGFLLIEDFGDVSFARALTKGLVPPIDLYALAADVLAHLRARPALPALPLYRESAVHKGHRRVIDWYVPLVMGKPVTGSMIFEYLDIWEKIESSLQPMPGSFLHVDFHVQNLMWLPRRAGLKRCGLLDFQGAMLGPFPYDLANLLEDARIDVPAPIARAVLEQACAGMSRDARADVMAWYRVLGTQFHCRWIGQLLKIAMRQNNPQYIGQIPRLSAYINAALEAEILKPLKDFFMRNRIAFGEIPDLDPKRAEGLIRPDAA